MADQETDEPKKKGGLVKIIGLVLGGLLLVGVGLGAGFFMFGGNGATPSAEIEQIIERKLKESGQLPEDDPAEGETEGEEPPGDHAHVSHVSAGRYPADRGARGETRIPRTEGQWRARAFLRKPLQLGAPGRDTAPPRPESDRGRLPLASSCHCQLAQG